MVRGEEPLGESPQRRQGDAGIAQAYVVQTVDIRLKRRPLLPCPEGLRRTPKVSVESRDVDVAHDVGGSPSRAPSK